MATENLSGGVSGAVPQNSFVVTYLNGKASEVVSSCDTSASCAPAQTSNFALSGNTLSAYGTTGYPSASFSNATATDVGTTNIGGSTYGWGRLGGSTSIVASTGASLVDAPALYAFTNDQNVINKSAFPSSGAVDFVFVGGPKPIDAGGVTGSMKSMSGSVDFASRLVTMKAAIDMNLPSFGSANFAVSGSGTVSPSGNALTNAPLAWNCSGAGCATSTGSGTFDSRFFGANLSQAMLLNGALSSATKPGSNSVLFLGILKCAKC